MFFIVEKSPNFSLDLDHFSSFVWEEGCHPVALLTFWPEHKFWIKQKIMKYFHRIKLAEIYLCILCDILQIGTALKDFLFNEKSFQKRIFP